MLLLTSNIIQIVLLSSIKAVHMHILYIYIYIYIYIYMHSIYMVTMFISLLEAIVHLSSGNLTVHHC